MHVFLVCFFLYMRSVDSHVCDISSSMSCRGQAKWAHLHIPVRTAVCEYERDLIFALFWSDRLSSRGLNITVQQLFSSKAETQKSECSNPFFSCFLILVLWLRLFCTFDPFGLPVCLSLFCHCHLLFSLKTNPLFLSFSAMRLPQLHKDKPAGIHYIISLFL